MARLVIGLGSSHSPMVVTDAPMWEQRAIVDHTSPDLYDLAGNHCTYEELARSGKSYERECRLDHPSARFQGFHLVLRGTYHPLSEGCEQWLKALVSVDRKHPLVLPREHRIGPGRTFKQR